MNAAFSLSVVSRHSFLTDGLRKHCSFLLVADTDNALKAREKRIERRILVESKVLKVLED